MLGDMPRRSPRSCSWKRFIRVSAALYQERGHCYVALRRRPRAIEAFLRAVNINPALPASWSMLEGLYRMTGAERTTPRTAAAHVAILKCTAAGGASVPPACFRDGELAAAEQVIRAFLLEHGDHVEAMRLLARIGVARDVLDDAQILLEARARARAGLPGRALRICAACCIERHQHAAAQVQARAARGASSRDNRDYRTLYASDLRRPGAARARPRALP